MINEQCEVRNVATIVEGIIHLVLWEDLKLVIWDSVERTYNGTDYQLKLQCKGRCRLDANGLYTEVNGGLNSTIIEWNNDIPLKRAKNAIEVVKKYCPGQEKAKF
jgi:hypothetical protein